MSGGLALLKLWWACEVCSILYVGELLMNVTRYSYKIDALRLQSLQVAGFHCISLAKSMDDAFMTHTRGA